MDDGSILKIHANKSVIGKSSSSIIHKTIIRRDNIGLGSNMNRKCEYILRLFVEFSSTSVAVMENIGVFQVFLVRYQTKS